MAIQARWSSTAAIRWGRITELDLAIFSSVHGIPIMTDFKMCFCTFTVFAQVKNLLSKVCEEKSYCDGILLFVFSLPWQQQHFNPAHSSYPGTLVSSCGAIITVNTRLKCWLVAPCSWLTSCSVSRPSSTSLRWAPLSREVPSTLFIRVSSRDAFRATPLEFFMAQCCPQTVRPVDSSL